VGEARERWDRKYAGRPAEPGLPDGFLLACADRLPTAGKALDVAGGAGRHALWLAARGLDVTIADVSPVGLQRATDAAAARGLAVKTQAMDLEADPRLPDGPWDLILCFHFLFRPIYGDFARVLAPGGTLVVCHPTRTNLQRHAHPSARFLLEDGELEGLVPGVQVLSLEEGWSPAGRHEARLVARRAVAG
jgi:tellurite methyltransferase